MSYRSLLAADILRIGREALVNGREEGHLSATPKMRLLGVPNAGEVLAYVNIE